MERLIVLMAVVAIPLILVPVAFVWYLNVSGLYQVIRDARQRQRKRLAREKEKMTAVETAR